jgi:hypothetical protein
LSRACLGKMMHFIYKWRKNAVFRRHKEVKIRLARAEKAKKAEEAAA